MDALKDHVLVVAWVCYEAERAYSNAHSDTSMKPWEKLSVGKRQFYVDKVMQHIMHPNLGPADLHKIWYDDMATVGFVHGDKYSEQEKTHPSMLPYELLPWHIQKKDDLFYSIFQSLTKEILCQDTE
jgi:hypothetical protein